MNDLEGSPSWDEQIDVVIIGSGAAGLTGAVFAARHGLTSIVFEKAKFWGGTTALSGGGVWVPCNQLQREAGLDDSVESAAAYLDELVEDHGLATSATRRMAFLRHAPAMVNALIEEGIKWRVDPQPDYAHTAHASVGRNLDAALFDLTALGGWRHTMRRGAMPFALTLAEIPALARGFSSVANFATIIRMLLRQKLSQLLGKEMVGCGASLAAQLMAIVQRRAVEVRLNSSLSRVIVNGGRVVGVVLKSDGKDRHVAARKGLLLAGGGFSHAEQRQTYQGFDGRFSSASPDDTGDLIGMADELGAMTALMKHAWWATSFLYPGNVPVFFQWERTLPFALIVDDQGQRIANESGDYDSFGAAMIQRGIRTAWLILDGRHRRRYFFGAMRPGVTSQSMFDSGFFKHAETITSLAHLCGINVEAFKTTIERFNEFADRGIDEDFGRGNYPYDRYWGDPNCKPNPNLGRIDTAPFLATRVHLGDLGTRGGFVVDQHCRVLNLKGAPISGLYAAGNCSASMMGTAYPGPGATLGPAMTAALQAIQHIATTQTP